MNILPTSNIEGFKKQLASPNTQIKVDSQESQIAKIQKNLVIASPSDSTGCGNIRTVFPMTYLNALYGKTNRFSMLVTPMPIYQHEILMRTRTIYIQRWFDKSYIDRMKQYKDIQSKYGYKLIYEIDDFIWYGDREGELIPSYNFGSEGISKQVGADTVEIMNMADLITVSSEFIGQYIKETQKVKPPTYFLPNVVNQFFWGSARKRPIKEKIVRPKVLYSGSQCHYHSGKKMLGDFEGLWYDWLIKSIKDNKIEFCVMGGCPWFLEEVKNKIKIVEWVNSFSYHQPIKDFKPDIMIGPLVENYFNASKSDIKYIEACAAGAAFIGSVFTKGLPSPYDKAFLKVPATGTAQDIQNLVDYVCEPDTYNKVLKMQYDMLQIEGRWMESEQNIQHWINVL